MGYGKGVLETPFNKACKKKMSYDGGSLNRENVIYMRCFQDEKLEESSDVLNISRE